MLHAKVYCAVVETACRRCCTRDVTSARNPCCIVFVCVAANTQCFDADCYLYAFGLPAILMIIAIGKCYFPGIIAGKLPLANYSNFIAWLLILVATG